MRFPWRLSDSIQSWFEDPHAWLLAVGLGLIALHLQLFWRLTGSFDQLSLELMGWAALGYRLWQRRQTIVLQRDRVSQALGWGLIGLILVRSWSLQTASNTVLGLTPLPIGIAIALLAVGLQQFKHYQRELWLVAAIAFPLTACGPLLDRFLNSSVLMAKYSHLLMWYSGFIVERQGVRLAMPTGAVEILYACSGLDAALISLKVAIFFLLVFPTHWRNKLLVPLAAIASAFLVNGFRIMLMAYLVSHNQMAAFNYWHSGDGSQVFAMISMTVFTQYCQFLIDRSPNPVL
jgi:cyanoexosortase A